jgi:hypothetical protein
MVRMRPSGQSLRSDDYGSNKLQWSGRTRDVINRSCCAVGAGDAEIRASARSPDGTLSLRIAHEGS